MKSYSKPFPLPPHLSPAGALKQPDDALEGLAPLLSAGLAPIAPQADAEAALRGRLLARVARSAQAHRPFHTVRREDGVWSELAPGVRAKLLHRGAGVRSALLELAPGAQWSCHGKRAVEECLVLQGEVALGDLQLAARDYHLITIGAGQARPKAHTQRGALLYLRGSAADGSAFGGITEPRTVRYRDSGWEPLRHGVEVKPLCSALLGSDEMISMLVRMQPGASVPTHSHGRDEDCVMLEGELFLGDVLLREGEFQWAPAGSGHQELYSDVGCTLFFHGAVDPVVVDPAVAGLSA